MYSLEGLPADGRLWWLRWFDHPSWDRSTGTRHIDVVLSLLPSTAVAGQLPQLDAHLAASDTRFLIARVHAGLIPALALGMVYCNAKPVGMLEMEQKSFIFTKESCTIRLVPIHEIIPSLPLFPGIDGLDNAVIDPTAYPLEGFDDSYCVQIRSTTGEKAELILPCNEIFRTFYAPHRSIALAFTNGPWGKTQTEVIHKKPDRPTKVYPDGNWLVSLAGYVGREHAAVLGNLVLNTEGLRSAKQVWEAIINPSSYMRGLVTSGRRSPRFLPGRLRAPIPFEFDTLQLKIHGFKPQADVESWIGLRIEAFAWPPPPLGPPKTIRWRAWKDTTKGKSQKPVDRPPPYSGLTENADPSGDLPIDPDVDPSRGSQGRLIQAPGATQLNPPRLRRAKKETSNIYTGSPRPRGSKTVGTLSGGNAAPGNTGAAPAQASTKTSKPGSTRFAEVLAMLGRLKADAQIHDFDLVLPEPQAIENRGSVGAFRLSPAPSTKMRKNSWFKIDSETFRSAMVCVIYSHKGSFYWIEIELKASETGYRSLIFTILNDTLELVVAALLRIAIQCRGIWPDGSVLCAEAGAHRSIGWTHSQVGGHLNGKRALDAISDLFLKDDDSQSK